MTQPDTISKAQVGLPRHGHWINGALLQPSSGEYLPTVNPATEEVVAEIASGGRVDVDAAVTAATEAQPAWARHSPRDRGRILISVADALRQATDAIVAAECADTGKVPAHVAFEVSGTADYFEYYASVVRTLHGETVDLGPQQHVFTRREPFGVVAIITPWNAAVNQGARGIAPALASGNSVVLKPSEFTSLSSLVMAQVAEEAGLPAGLLNVVTGLGPEVGTPLIEDARVGRVTFTGSVATGRLVAQAAARRLIPVTLELGGKSPNIIFADADLGRAIETAAQAFTGNAGQACSAGTRLLIERPVYDDVVNGVAEELATIRLGETMGPIITRPQFEKVQSYFQIAADEGAVAVCGAHASPVAGRGYYIAPTLYRGVTNDMRVAQEEIFGPVAVAIPFDDEEEAIRLANDVDYGLVAGVWTSDVDRALRVAPQLEAGQVFINDWTGNVETPFGGYKDSGYGREKGFEALNDYTRLKSVLARINLATR